MDEMDRQDINQNTPPPPEAQKSAVQGVRVKELAAPLLQGVKKSAYTLFGVIGAAALIGSGINAAARNASPISYSATEYPPKNAEVCPGSPVEWESQLHIENYEGPLNLREIIRHRRGASVVPSGHEYLLLTNETTPDDIQAPRSFYIDPAWELAAGDYEILVYIYSPVFRYYGTGYSVPFVIGEECPGVGHVPPVETAVGTGTPQAATVVVTATPTWIPTATPTPDLDPTFPTALTVTPTAIMPTNAPTATATHAATSTPSPTPTHTARPVVSPTKVTQTVDPLPPEEVLGCDNYPCFNHVNVFEFEVITPVWECLGSIVFSTIQPCGAVQARQIELRQPGDRLIGLCTVEFSAGGNLWVSEQKCESVESWSAVRFNSKQYMNLIALR